MFKSVKVASVAAASFATTCFLLAYGATTAANAQVRSFDAPVIVAPDVATPVEQPLSHSSEADIGAAAAVTDEAPASSLAQLVSEWTIDAPLDAQARCLATAVFFESRSESLEGQLAVAHVVLERARSGRFADSICGVIKQPGQFGFVRSGRLPTATDGAQWRTAQAIAQIALNESWRNPAEGALYFHATHRSPDWGRPMVTKIGRHVFYR